MHMKKKYIYILIIYVAAQLSTLVAVPLLSVVATVGFNDNSIDTKYLIIGGWFLFSFFAALAGILLILRKSEPYTKVEKGTPMPLGGAIGWGVLGVFLAFIAQAVAILIETAIGIDPGSENTQDLLDMINFFPWIIIIISIVGPILEEIVFRKVIFGMFYNRFPFWAAALLSSLIFSVAHMDFTHILLYTAMGFVFAFLYVRTKRIIVPIIAHVMMNTMVIIVQYVAVRYLENYIKETEKMLNWIGGFFL
ncbi:MAG TPA: type II CAAX endopeptidase family protein [Bacillaceae bacterium]